MKQSSMDRVRAWRGPAVLSWGFRPFFLLAALTAMLAMAGWAATLWLGWSPPGRLDPLAWHVHELLYGYLSAVVAGFLLTAVPNWTGRLPVLGAPLAGLAALWTLGRIAVVLPESAPAVLVAVATLLFPLALIAYLGREIVAARAHRNAVVLVLLGGYAAGQALFHYELSAAGFSVQGQRLSIGAILMLVMLIGGRIAPSFTTNWLRQRAMAAGPDTPPGPLPTPFNRFDAIALGVSALVLAAWIAQAEQSKAFGVAAIFAAAANLLRQARWTPWRVRREPLLAVLHVAFAFAPLGFLLLGLSSLTDGALQPVAGVHAWTAGAFGVMTLGVMVRATRGHTGRPLTADRATLALFATLTAAAAARIGAGLAPAVSEPLTMAAAAGWIASFGLFLALYGGALTRARSG